MSESLINNLVEAISKNDVDGFRASLTHDFARDFSPTAIAAVIEPLVPRLRARYSIKSIGSFNQQGMVVDFYQITVADGGDDILIRAIVEDGQIAGLLITAPFD